MNDIEFLPADYVCVQITRTNNNWLRGLFVAVLSLMAIGWVAQQKSLRDLSARRERLQQQSLALFSNIDSNDSLLRELNEAESGARLLDGLRTQVPPTRWLTAIVDALPTESCLTEIHAEVDEGTESPVRPDPNASNKPKLPPLLQDLERLAKLTPRRTLSILVRGSADDDIQVSRFLTALHKSQSFERVQLLFTDQHAARDKPIRSFAIRLRTRTVNTPASQRATTAPVAFGDRGRDNSPNEPR